MVTRKAVKERLRRRRERERQAKSLIEDALANYDGPEVEPDAGERAFEAFNKWDWPSIGEDADIAFREGDPDALVWLCADFEECVAEQRAALDDALAAITKEED